jgi:hypothetical protein
MDDDILLALVRAALRDEPPAALVDVVASWPAPGPYRAAECEEE